MASRAGEIDAAAAPECCVADVLDSMEAGRSFGGSASVFHRGDDTPGVIFG
jgi:hypothetical protein